MIELLFLASEFQCGSSAPQAVFEVVVNDEHRLRVGQSIRVEELYTVEVEGVDSASCAILPGIAETVWYGETVPSVSGAYNQQSLQTIVNENLTDEFEFLRLLELGTTNPDSSYFDLQDIVLVVDTDPEIIYAD